MNPGVLSVKYSRVVFMAMALMLMSFNVAALPVSMSGMVVDLDTPPTTVGTAIVLYSLGVSGFILLGSKMGQRFGSKTFFQISVGTSLMGALLVGVLGSLFLRELVDNPTIPVEFKQTELTEHFDLDNINFINNDRLKERLAETTATPEKIEEAVRMNTETRLQSLKIGFLVLSGLLLLAILPCGWLPDYQPGEVPKNLGDGRPQKD
ncbi:MAG: hypothetical protein SGJ20_09355 [Planctomycetota bacterium]|nr:hypothetical protein [Planctomycetota bacterium]